MSSAQLLELNPTEADTLRSGPPQSIADCFAAQVARTPDAIALITAVRTVTYRELDVQSSRLAYLLQLLGVGPETLVGVGMERSATLVVSLLAILKAGGAYVPLDLNFPKERLALVIEDSGMPFLLTTARSRSRIPESSVAVVDAENPVIAKQSAVPAASIAAPHNLAYVIYTSGSTGRPKGVMVEHRNVVNFFSGMDVAIGRAPGVWLAVTSVSFDISVLELLWTLTRGFTVVLHDEAAPRSIAEEIVRYGVTHLQMTPSLARMLTLDSRAFSALGGLKQMLLGGEAVPAALVHRLRQGYQGEIHNMYGPTETTIWSTTCAVEEAESVVPIGRPIANTQVFVLDEQLNPVAPGQTGELYIGGDGVARGYWNRPDLTAERFLTLPALCAERIYRTGDLVRVLPDNNLEFLGRADFQVKLRGHRIELGEIEALLEQQPGIRQAVLVLREDREGDKRLVAYCVADPAGVPEGADMRAEGTGFSSYLGHACSSRSSALEGDHINRAAALRAALASSLPDYMVPSAFVFLDAMPLTGNGKTDRKALLNLAPPIPPQPVNGVDLPATETERLVALAWQQALGVPKVGLTENFFDLGAHSLTVAEAHARLQEALGREIPLVDLFQYTTVSDLARHLAGLQAAPPASLLSERAARRRLARQG